MEPSKFWRGRIAKKRAALKRPAALANFRANELGHDIDDCGSHVQPDKRISRIWRAWEKLGHRIDKDLLYLVDEIDAGRPAREKVGEYNATSGSIEFAFLATRLRQYLRNSTCEIGGGYGGLARALKETVRHRYAMVDYPELQTVQQYYLERAGFPDIAFLSPGEKLISADLYINTRSMMEMDYEQVDWYIREIDTQANIGAHFFSMNRDKLTNMRDWAIPKSWKPVFDQPYPMYEIFRMQLWEIA